MMTSFVRATVGGLCFAGSAVSVAAAATTARAAPPTTAPPTTTTVVVISDPLFPLTVGSNNPAVAVVQQRLDITVDCDFGNQTAQAVRDWQTALGDVAVTGQVGPEEWALFDVPLVWGVDTNGDGVIAPSEVSIDCADPTFPVEPASVPPGTPVAPTDPDLASRIPAVDGYSVTDVPVDDVLWRLFDDSLPSDLTRHHGHIVAADGARVAHLVVAAADAGQRPAIDTFVEHTFANDVFLPASSVETEQGTFATMNSAPPVWKEMESNAVLVAEQQIDGNFQWAWGAEDLVWIVRGTSVAEPYVRALLRVHAASLEPFDYQGMLGALWDHTPLVPGYEYHDLPRVGTLSSDGSRGFPDGCSERFYIGAVFPDGVSVSSIDTDDLLVALEKAGSRCVREGLLEQTAALIASGRRAEQIGGLTVFRDEQVIGALVGDVLITLYSTNPQTYVDMAPFIEQFFAGQPAG